MSLQQTIQSKCVFIRLLTMFWTLNSRDCNISFNMLETCPSVCKSLEPKRFAEGEGRVSSKLSDMLQFVEIVLFLRTKRTHLL